MNYFDKISDWHGGHLTPVEEVYFEEEYDNNPELKAACEDYKLIQQAMWRRKKHAFLKQQKNLEETINVQEHTETTAKIRVINSRRKNKKNRFLKWKSIAAAAILLLMTYFAIPYIQDMSEANRITKTIEHKDYPDFFNQEAKGFLLGKPAEKDAFLNARATYNKKNYEAALVQLQQFETDYPEGFYDDLNHFYQAICLLKTANDNNIKNLEKAHDLLEQLSVGEIYPVKKVDVKWYYALTLAKMDQKEQAITTLEEIFKLDKKHQKARHLLEQLKK